MERLSFYNCLQLFPYKHVQNKHFREFYYHCKYCNYGTDEAHLLENYISGKHKLGVRLPCVNLGCLKMFNSTVSRGRYIKYCGVAKSLKCQYCEKVYKREANLKNTMRLFTKESEQLFIASCANILTNVKQLTQLTTKTSNATQWRGTLRMKRMRGIRRWKGVG